LTDLTNKQLQESRGFTLIEIMVTLVVAMVILGGLLLSFTQQNSEYKYQNKRIDAAQDLEFAIKFVAEDLRSALMNATAPTITLVDDGTDPFATTSIDFFVWDEVAVSAGDRRAHRKYAYNAATKSLRYDREIAGGDSTGTANSEILPNVTFFKVFNDSVARPAAYTGIPSAQPAINLVDPPLANVSGYTILIEVEVDAGYKEGSFINVRGVDVGITGHKRIWRYVQVYPRTSVL